jgi:hypothetical protein
LAKNCFRILVIASAVCLASASTVCERSLAMPTPALVPAPVAARPAMMPPAPAIGPMPGFSELLTVA